MDVVQKLNTKLGDLASSGPNSFPSSAAYQGKCLMKRGKHMSRIRAKGQGDREHAVNRGSLQLHQIQSRAFILLGCQNIVVVTMNQCNFPPKSS